MVFDNELFQKRCNQKSYLVYLLRECENRSDKHG